MQKDFLDKNGVWCQLLGDHVQVPNRPALFLDRDGVIVEDVAYLHRPGDVVLITGAAEVIAAANRANIPVVIVTNQAGIARGYYGWADFQQVQGAILHSLECAGARVDAVLACPHHESGSGEYFHPCHPSRKPRPGMLLRAAGMLDLELRRSWIVGDRTSDLLAGRAAGLRGGILVLTGQGPAHRQSVVDLQTPDFEVRIADSVRQVTALLPLFSQNDARGS